MQPTMTTMTPHRPTDPPSPTDRAPSVAWRAIALGALLVPANVWFVIHGLFWGQSRPTTVSLIFNVITTLLVVAMANNVVRRLQPRWALSHGELLVIYGMLSVASATAGLDQIQTMMEVVAHPIWGATVENKWEELFLGQMPAWLTVTDPAALDAYFDGRMPMLSSPYWRPWVPVALLWSGFSFILLATMLCLNTLFRRQWTDEAKLSFPVVQLPLELARPRCALWSSALFWIGFGAALFIDTLNGLHFLYPKVPHILGESSSAWDLGTHVKNMPWRAIGWTPMRVFPFGMGLAFFIPLDLAFSQWFFYVVFKIVRIGSAALGWGNLPKAPWIDEQMHAAYLALAVLCLYSSRKHLQAAVHSVLGKGQFDDRAEPLPYAWAFWGAVGGLAALMVFCLRAGMSLWAAAAFMLIYLGLSIAVARIRAELGSPVHDLHKIGPEAVLTEVLGPRALGVKNLVMFAYFWSFNRAHRSHPMPHQIEAMKLADETGTSQHEIAVSLTIAAALGILLGWGIMLDANFRYGGRSYKGQEAFGRLQSWLTSPGETNWYAVAALVIGGAFTVFLASMRTRFAWWPLHPAGFAVAGGWSMALFAPSILAAWLVKTIILRYGGMTSFRPASRFFLGMILGEFVAGSWWGLFGILTKRAMYNFLP